MYNEVKELDFNFSNKVIQENINNIKEKAAKLSSEAQDEFVKQDFAHVERDLDAILKQLQSNELIDNHRRAIIEQVKNEMQRRAEM